MLHTFEALEYANKEFYDIEGGVYPSDRSRIDRNTASNAGFVRTAGRL
jgi:hypothetical protein